MQVGIRVGIRVGIWVRVCLGFGSGLGIRVQRRIRTREQVGVLLTCTAIFALSDAFFALSTAACASAAYVSDNSHVWNHDAKRRVEEARWRSGVVARGYTAARLLLFALPE